MKESIVGAKKPIGAVLGENPHRHSRETYEIAPTPLK